MSGARFLVGCAISNDLNNLRRHGIDLPADNFTIFETQNWYWLLNDDSDRNTKNQAGLSTMADTYHVSFGDKGPHSATADTDTTLKVFRCLVEHFAHRYDNEQATSAFNPDIDNAELTKTLSTLNADFIKAYTDAMHVYRMRNAGGYLSVHRRENGYSIKGHHLEPVDNPDIVMSVVVGDRKNGEIELRKHFEDKTVKGFTGIFALDNDDFEFIRNYTNTVDADKFMAEKRRHHRRHSRFLKRSPDARDTKTDKRRKK